MDWQNERYVRLYTRMTADLLAFGWEGRFVWYELLRHADRSGVIGSSDPLVLADLLRIPPEIFTAGLDRVVARGAIELGDDEVVIPNFIEAQEARSSDAQRQRDARERRRDRARSTPLSPRDTKSRAVTKPTRTVTDSRAGSRSPQDALDVDFCDSRDERSQPVTECRADVVIPVKNVTPSLAVPDRAVPSLTSNIYPVAQDGATGGRTNGVNLFGEPVGQQAEQEARTHRVHALADAAIVALNQRRLATDRGGKVNAFDSRGKKVLADFDAILKKDPKVVPAEAAAVVAMKWTEWHNTKDQKWLRPSTLFRPSNFAGYLEDYRGGYDEELKQTRARTGYADAPPPDSYSDDDDIAFDA